MDTITVALTPAAYDALAALCGIWLREPEQVVTFALAQLAEHTLLGDHGRVMTPDDRRALAALRWRKPEKR